MTALMAIFSTALQLGLDMDVGMDDARQWCAVCCMTRNDQSLGWSLRMPHVSSMGWA